MMTNISSGSYTSLGSTVKNFSVSPRQTDETSANEAHWDNKDWSRNLGYYLDIPEYKKAVDALEMWTCGLGGTCKDINQQKIIEHITGNGKENFISILRNMIRVKKVNGDSYAEIIREDDVIVNLKPISPSNVKVFYTEKGIIKGYEVKNADGTSTPLKPNQMFHLINDRVAGEIHGRSVGEACKWVIDARNEAMSDWRRVLHRSTIRVLYVDMDNRTKLAQLKQDYAEAMAKGEVLVLPAKPGEAELKDYTAPPIQAFLEWIQYLENFFYQAVGISKAILGGTQGATEASSKVSMMTFEQPHMTERQELEREIWNQLQIKIDFDEPNSITNDMQQSEAANTGQVGFQANDTQVNMLNKQ